jgi:geranylgeranyl pyrophosphate synthase
MNRKKTGALLRTACRFGCLAAGAGAEQTAAATAYAEAVGLLFQVTDDLLDVTGESAVLGKPAGSDEARQKATWVGLLGLAGARRYAGVLAEEALAALAPYGDEAGYLRWLAEFILRREQ